ncbi:DUF1858 domain-containing protein [Fundicoccus sp. Sow4_H7]|uniref:DUF1858 domain-containing protein n=1 Tax=Fundicoccus sp. Sow4_H7 TaxID=3438784 RepID=UPI003F938D3B
MDNKIDLNTSVFNTLEKHPELLDILIDLGFTPLKNPVMRNTVTKATSLKQGCKIIGIKVDQLIKNLQWNGYEVIDL